ncbi:hypothetical protein Srufu_044340 [Streptomyces libani subsp. rufus]|nr:hypothetical protein Srufu_044340 [Streptomyces libani subsp. rufus]
MGACRRSRVGATELFPAIYEAHRTTYGSPTNVFPIPQREGTGRSGWGFPDVKRSSPETPTRAGPSPHPTAPRSGPARRRRNGEVPDGGTAENVGIKAAHAAFAHGR